MFFGQERYTVFERQVRIVYDVINKMQSTPLLERNNWVIQFPRKAIYKTPNMGWVYQDDNRSKRNIYYSTLEEAIDFCKKQGLTYEVDYPRFRSYKVKSYADNFKWKGEPKEDDE